MYNPPRMEFQACRKKWGYHIGTFAHSTVGGCNRENKHFKLVLRQSVDTMQLNLTRHCAVIRHSIYAVGNYLSRPNNRNPRIKIHPRTARLGKYHRTFADKCLPRAYFFQGKVPVNSPTEHVDWLAWPRCANKLRPNRNKARFSIREGIEKGLLKKTNKLVHRVTLWGNINVSKFN